MSSPSLSAGAERRCAWCRSLLATGQARWCSKRCRQTAWRLRRLGGSVAEVLGDGPRRLAYADPPYPGKAKRWYGREATYAGEVDHAALIDQLRQYDGWALSTSREALRDVLSLAPGGTLVCPWVKTHHQPDAYGPGNIHEYVLVKPARWRRPGPPDAFVGAVAKGGGSNLMGRKPIKFVHWVFELLGASAADGDTLADLFPGSGVVGRCWQELRRRQLGDVEAAASDVVSAGHDDARPPATV